MKQLSFLLALTSLCITASAQNYKVVNKRIERINEKLADTWFGTIVFNNDSELTCKFTYNPLIDGGVLFVSMDSANSVYSANAVKSFSFRDDQTGELRYFYSLLLSDQGSKRYFFELLHNSDQIAIISENTFTVRNVYDSNPYSGRLKTNNPKVKKRAEKYLLDHRDGKAYGLCKKQIMRMTEDKKDAITSFIKGNKLFYDESKIEDYIAVVDYYSSLKKQNP